MISVVLVPGPRSEPPSGEIIARSLGWLVSAVVAGVVRDVTLAVPSSDAIRDLVEETGCALAESDEAAGLLAAGVRLARSAQILVLRLGYTAERGLIDDFEDFGRTAAHEECALIHAAAGRWRLKLAPAVGVVASRRRCMEASSFDQLRRRCRRGVRLPSRMRPIRS